MGINDDDDDDVTPSTASFLYFIFKLQWNLIFLYAHKFLSNFTSSKTMNIGWFIWEKTNQIIHESIARKLLIFTVK